MTNPSPLPQEVNAFHAKSDKDSSQIAQHHTLGIDHNQASPGDHKHEGKTSKLIGAGVDPSFPISASASYSQTEMNKIIAALRALGFGQS